MILSQKELAQKMAKGFAAALALNSDLHKCRNINEGLLREIDNLRNEIAILRNQKTSPKKKISNKNQYTQLEIK